ncbi:MAG: hypothetical protein H6708_31105 [Kofleriaceae bacterium]|nr:hypothetical protein [Kofleriaceae bacterium]
MASVAYAPAGGAEAPWPDIGAAATRCGAAVTRLGEVCGVAAPEDDVVAWLRARLPRWQGAVTALRDWAAYVRARRDADGLGLTAAVAACERGEVVPAALAEAWERAVLLAWTDARVAAEPALRDFHGSSHHARVAELADLDRAWLAVARSRTVTCLAERVPRVAPGADAGTAEGGEVGVLLHELKKQRRHKPLRALFARMPNLLGRLKPCLMMSPLSVAQYLDPSLPRFDVVVFDEASQIPTADAIGALARGNAAVVVGDSRQLPPTRFFEIDAAARAERAPDGGGAGDDDDEPYEELESILDECVAARLPELRLGWHYRSRHEDLIAFSNRHYYDDRLDVFPAAAARVPGLGVAWRKVDGVYDRGGTRQNRIEAEAVVAEIVARLTDPAQAERSLGVVTFSRAQQTLIEDLLDDARRATPALERFFGDDVAEPVLVKNLETIQGDERDVVLFSIGYGPDAAGKLTMNFGPLGKDGGERRLNVAITRAREQLVVFSSIEPDAIAADAAAPGVRHLGELLGFVRDGGGAAAAADRAPSSAIVASIAAALTARGWSVQPSVGCAGYRIDLAVVDPDDSGRYVLGIECDGAAYAAAPVARDRDRLRGQVLAGLGWRLHRIWALDWWLDPDKEAQRMHSAVIAAIAALRQARRAQAAPTRPPRTARTSSGPVARPGAGSGRDGDRGAGGLGCDDDRGRRDGAGGRAAGRRRDRAGVGAGAGADATWADRQRLGAAAAARPGAAAAAPPPAPRPRARCSRPPAPCPRSSATAPPRCRPGAAGPTICSSRGSRPRSGASSTRSSTPRRRSTSSGWPVASAPTSASAAPARGSSSGSARSSRRAPASATPTTPRWCGAPTRTPRRCRRCALPTRRSRPAATPTRSRWPRSRRRRRWCCPATSACRSTTWCARARGCSASPASAIASSAACAPASTSWRRAAAARSRASARRCRSGRTRPRRACRSTPPRLRPRGCAARAPLGVSEAGRRASRGRSPRAEEDVHPERKRTFTPSGTRGAKHRAWSRGGGRRVA